MDKDLLGGDEAISSLEAVVTPESLGKRESSVLWHRLFSQVRPYLAVSTRISSICSEKSVQSNLCAGGKALFLCVTIPNFTLHITFASAAPGVPHTRIHTYLKHAYLADFAPRIAGHASGERSRVPQAWLLLDTSRLGACERLWFETRRARRNGDFVYLVENREGTQQPNVSTFGEVVGCLHV